MVIESRNGSKLTALTYALLLLVQGALSAQISSLALWFSRRCYDRTRGELILSVYEKAVVRKVIVSPEKLKSNETAGDSASGVHSNGHGQSSNETGMNPIRNSKQQDQRDGMNGATTKKKDNKSNLSITLTLFKEAFWPTAVTETKPIVNASTGQILNLVRTDANDIAKQFVNITRLVKTPIGAIFSVWLIWRFLGWSSFLGIAVVVTGLIINGFVARIQVRWFHYRKKATDERVQMNSQFIQVIRNLRWYGWEEIWLDKVMAVRRHEMNARIVGMTLNILTYIVTVVSGSFVPVVVFFAYTAIAGNKLRIDLIFPTLQLLRNLQTWLREIPTMVSTLLNAYVSLSRIENFLKEPEKEGTETVEDRAQLSTDLMPLRFVDCSFAWPGTTDPIIQGVDLEVKPGITMIYGQIGGGKTALLQAILGEMEKLSGESDIPNEIIGYYSQTPWLQSLSIRDNILFYSPYDEERYQTILESCALLPDLATFPDGDLSHIGEK
jgi:ABC-type multidrug transport system fused ATPase/permease subunit